MLAGGKRSHAILSCTVHRIQHLIDGLLLGCSDLPATSHSSLSCACGSTSHHLISLSSLQTLRAIQHQVRALVVAAACHGPAPWNSTRQCADELLHSSVMEP